MYEAFQSESDPGDHGWQDDANCLGVDPDLFFPERGASTREAKEVCRGCVVREECLEFALQNGEKFGIWGGLSEGSVVASAASGRRPPAACSAPDVHRAATREPSRSHDGVN